MSNVNASAVAICLGLALNIAPASAAVDHNYELVGAKAQSFDVYNDGKNTYIEVVRGLVVPGSKRDGESFVIEGVPPVIDAAYAGKKLRITLRTASTKPGEHTQTGPMQAATDTPIAIAPENPPATTTALGPTFADLREEIRAQLKQELKAIEAREEQRFPLQSSVESKQPSAPEEMEKGPEVEVEAPRQSAPAGTATPASNPSLPSPQAAPNQSDAVPGKNATLSQSSSSPTAQPTVNEAFKVSETVMFEESVSTQSHKVTVIKKGQLIGEVLKDRAVSEGWTFLWYSKKHWEAIGDIDISKYKTADEAAEDIVNGLRDEGKPIQLRISEGNKVMEVFSTEVKND